MIRAHSQEFNIKIPAEGKLSLAPATVTVPRLTFRAINPTMIAIIAARAAYWGGHSSFSVRPNQRAYVNALIRGEAENGRFLPLESDDFRQVPGPSS